MISHVDLEELVCLQGRTFDWSVRDYEPYLNQPFVTLRRNGELIGFAMGRLVESDFEILKVFVHKRDRGRGEGRALTLNLLKEARRRGARRALLEVSEGNIPAVSLYRRLGFKKVSRRKDYYSRGDHALCMELSLSGR